MLATTGYELPFTQLVPTHPTKPGRAYEFIVSSVFLKTQVHVTRQIRDYLPLTMVSYAQEPGSLERMISGSGALGSTNASFFFPSFSSPSALKVLAMEMVDVALLARVEQRNGL